MNNMMRGMTAMLVLAACAPAAGQTTPKTTPKPTASTQPPKREWQFGRATGDTAMAVFPVTQKEPFTLHFRRPQRWRRRTGWSRLC